MTLLEFLRQVRFAYIAGTSVLIFLFIVGLFEIIRYAFDQTSDPELMPYLHFTRGAVTVVVLLGWIGWTLFEYRDRFQAALRQHDDQYRRILDATADAVVIVSADGSVPYTNPAADRLRAELGDSWLPVDRLHGSVADLEIEWIPPGASRRILNASVTTLSDAEGQVESWALVIRDITGQAVRLAQMERSERLASLGHMAAGVAHEIGNPLTAISSITQLLQRRLKDEEQLEMLGHVRDNIHRITRIVRDLVDFSRPKPVEVKAVDVNALMEQAVGLMRHDARCRNVDMRLVLAPDLPTIQAVPDKLHQVIVNLVLNAVDATAAMPAPAITLRSEVLDGYISMAVTDNGPGIPPDLQTRVFEPFFTTKAVGKGTGLGLSVSHHLVEQTGGRLELHSRPGHTEFRILVPLPV
jgi:signal transduction histidine kinase